MYKSAKFWLVLTVTYLQIYISQRFDKKGRMVPSILQFQFKTNLKEGQVCIKTLFISNRYNRSETLCIKINEY